MTRAIVVAAFALVVIGALEALESAREMSEATGSPSITTLGASASALGLLASCGVYVILGWGLGNDGGALRAGAIAGALAGLIGGTLRVLIVGEQVAYAIARAAPAPEWFISLVFVVFVVGAICVSAAAGAALAFLGVRLARAIRSARSRPPA